MPLSEARDGFKHDDGNGIENGNDDDAMNPVKDGGVLVEEGLSEDAIRATIRRLDGHYVPLTVAVWGLRQHRVTTGLLPID